MINDVLRARLEKQLSKALGGKWAGVSADLIKKLGDPPSIENISPKYWTGFSDSTAAELQKQLVTVLTRSATATSDLLGLSSSVNWTLINTRAVTWSKRYAYDLVEGITSTSRDKLALYVSDYLASPSRRIDALEERIAKLFGPNRAHLIAVTETTRASVQGDLTLAKEIKRLDPNAAVREVWLTANDELVCPICSPLNNKPKGKGWTEEPPAHPRCRCSIGIELMKRKS